MIFLVQVNYNVAMDYFFLFVGAIIIIAALMIFSKYRKLINSQKNQKIDSRFRTQKTEDGKIDFVRCPICNTPLAKNENMYSRIFRPMTTADQRMTIQGCPHCYPHPEPGVKRTCPVCGRTLPIDGELIARLFNKTKDGKKHVIISSCSEEMKK